MSNLVPVVIEQTSRGERSFDLYSRLLSGTERDFILDARQALEYGLVDEILSDRQVVPDLSSITSSPSGLPAGDRPGTNRG